jgi:hypothetical protein
MNHWAKQAVRAGLLNGLVWLTPPPVHLIALVMPLASGYQIGSTTGPRWPLGWLAIGLVMGLTLGSVALAAGGLTLLAVATFVEDTPLATYTIVVLIISGGIGCYTALVGSIGAIFGIRRGQHG